MKRFPHEMRHSFMRAFLFVFSIALLLPCLALAQQLQFQTVATGLPNPTDIQAPRDGSGRLFVALQNGTIRIVRDGTLLAAPFLDIGSRVSCCNERGLLGLTFPPGFAQSGRFYVNYTNTGGHTEIAMYRVSANADIADPASGTVLMTIQQPFANHNGGGLAFGPDGYLYIGVGDGGGSGDPQNNGQNLNTLLGKILRVDVESTPGQVRNPNPPNFQAQHGARPEIWAFGLRNPWRFSFDRSTGDLWIADVGQNVYEEINVQAASSQGGENYGWRIMEGAHCFNALSCNETDLVQPIWEYDHSLGCSVTGGYVYRGSRSMGMRGDYIYGDYCSGRIWALRRGGGVLSNSLLVDTNYQITSFGEDEAGELYLGDARSGSVVRLLGPVQPRFSSANVVNAASFAPGLTPGSLATVFAAGLRDDDGISAATALPLPGTIDGIGVTIDGRDAPLHVVASVGGQEQINFQVPFETPVGDVTMTIRRGGIVSEPVSVPVRRLHPAIFASAGSAIVVHAATNALVTPGDPLREGEFAYFYASGLGPVSNQPATSAASPTSPLAETIESVRVTVGGAAAEVQFAGLAPGFAGVYQVNFRVPQNIASGPLNIAVQAGGETSPSVQTLVE